MHELRLVAVSEDGSYAVLVVPGRGGRFSLQIDDRLRAVARGQFSRLAQYEIEVESPLRPKEIQERIRAGETAEEIADAAGVPIERVRWFEGPVLAERAYRAEEAQSAMVRRPGDSGPGTRLGDVVSERLTALGTSTEDAHWDSIKRNDGTWQVQLLFNSGGRAKTAEWLYDPRRKHVTPTDDEAARLCLPEADLPPEPGQSHGGATVTPLQPRFSPPSGQGRRPGGRPADLPQPHQPQPHQPQPPAPPEWPAAYRDREPDRSAGYEREPAPAAHREPYREPAPSAHREPERGTGYGRDAERTAAARQPERTPAYADDAAGYPDELDRDEPQQPAARYRDAEPGQPRAPREHAASHTAAPEHEDDRVAARENEPGRGVAHEREADRVAARAAEAGRTAAHEPDADRVTARDAEPGRTAAHQREAGTARDTEPGRTAAHQREAGTARDTEPGRTAAHQREAGTARGAEPGRTSSHEPEVEQPAATHRAEPEAARQQPAATQRQAGAQSRKPDRGGRGRRERISAQQRKPEPEAAEAEAPAAPAAAASGQEAPRPTAAQGRRAAGGRGRRSSVPSWDEIMFGSSRPRD